MKSYSYYNEKVLPQIGALSEGIPGEPLMDVERSYARVVYVTTNFNHHLLRHLHLFQVLYLAGIALVFYIASKFDNNLAYSLAGAISVNVTLLYRELWVLTLSRRHREFWDAFQRYVNGVYASLGTRNYKSIQEQELAQKHQRRMLLVAIALGIIDDFYGDMQRARHKQNRA